ncbi:unnamed protein product [Orchesella dallaii]|uniref:Uncharacterized protein n=1 Tax=Orchesella dallaii TaxID=48710 RepID=A0ABP1RRZ2_9HEXA
MKIFVASVSIAVLAISYSSRGNRTGKFYFQKSDARRRGEKKCPDGKRPSTNTTEVKCDSKPGLRKALQCIKNCTDCYERELLQRLPACLVNGTCTCLAKPANGSTTLPPTTTTEETA